MIKIDKAARIANLPPYLFARIDKIKAEHIAKGVDVIDLTVGDPDLPTPKNIIAQMNQSVQDSRTHRYPSYVGMLSMRQAAAEWFLHRFNVELEPEREVIILIGSKEGIAHIPLAFIDNGDYGLVPDPGYPVYKTAILFAGGTPHLLPLLQENQFLPDLGKIPEEIARKTKLLFFNYPNNPTAAVGTREFYEEVVEFCQRYNIIACHDAAYTEIYFDGHKPMSFMEVAGAKEVGIEFHSLSKTFNMTGWRLAFAVGNAEVIDGLGQVKTNIDSGVFEAVQEAGIAALKDSVHEPEKLCAIYKERRDLLVSGLRKMGLTVEPPAATFYIWTPVPEGFTSMDFTTHLLNQSGILATPGNGFGPSGEGFIRFSLTASTDRIREAVERLHAVSF
jgi:LL-diaminopimelate aminotransferase